MINPEVVPFLFSVGTSYAYRIAKRYYNNKQYVWCAQHFDHREQPPTSNPYTIARRYIEQIRSGDRHATEIDSNKVGILKGAQSNFDKGIINKDELIEIRQLISMAEYKDFFPVLYIIDTKKVHTRCREVALKNRASDKSIEYIIEDLQENEYELIDIKRLFDDFIDIEDKRVGE